MLAPTPTRSRQGKTLPGHYYAANIRGSWPSLTILVHAGLDVLQAGRGTTKTGRVWTYVRHDRPGGAAEPPAMWLRYAPDRKGVHPAEHLKDCHGILQADRSPIAAEALDPRRGDRAQERPI